LFVVYWSFIVANLLGRNRKGDAILCYFWGETDRPVVVLAKTTKGVRNAIAEIWTGDHDGEEIDSVMRWLGENDFSERPLFTFEFEIGGAKFEDVIGGI